MTQVLVGVFDSFTQADQAAEHLAKMGISHSDIEIHATHDVTEPDDERLVADDVVQPAGEGTFDKIEHFFSKMFGGDERRAEVGHYQEAVRRGGALMTVSVINETQTDMVRSTMHEAGAVDIDERVTHWQNSGYQGYDPTAKSYSPEEVAADRKSFAVVRESLDVGKREVQTGGVRVFSRAIETPVSETVNLREEHATIERRPVDRAATAADLSATEVEVRETAEHAVIGKTARVVEEVVVGKEASERTETINETLHGTEVEVERIDEGKPATVAANVDSTKSDPATRR
jgi:uncharacterized protein (TIGR02271 family)